MIRSLSRRWADPLLRRENERLRDRGDQRLFVAIRLAKKLHAARDEAARLRAELDAMKEKPAQVNIPTHWTRCGPDCTGHPEEKT